MTGREPRSIKNTFSTLPTKVNGKRRWTAYSTWSIRLYCAAKSRIEPAPRTRPRNRSTARRRQPSAKAPAPRRFQELPATGRCRSKTPHAFRDRLKLFRRQFGEHRKRENLVRRGIRV